MELQEIISRGRFLFSNSPGKLEVFSEVDGRSTAKDIAARLKRHVNNVRRDLTSIKNVGLIQPVIKDGQPLYRDKFPIYEKLPLAREIPKKYFSQPIAMATADTKVIAIKAEKSAAIVAPLPMPDETAILDIARNGENQYYEFKAAGTDASKLAREICAMLNTRRGGIVFYGIDDDGTISGSDLSAQELDQSLQNAIRNAISPAAVVELSKVEVLGAPVIVILVPPWNKRHVYQHQDRILLRKGTNVFSARPEEVEALHKGRSVV